MRRNNINSTSGFKKDLKFGLLVPKNTHTRGKLAFKLHFEGIFAGFRDFVTAHAQKVRNTIISTSGFKMDLKFGLLVPKNI